MAELNPQPLPPRVLFPLLKALNPAQLKKGKFQQSSGGRVTDADKAQFNAMIDAAALSRTAQQFAKRLGNGNGKGGTVRAAAATALSITTLTVQYTSNGYTIVTIGYSDGHTVIRISPT